MAKDFEYAIKLTANIDNLEGQLKTVKQSLAKAFGEDNIPKGMQKTIDSISSKIDSLKAKSSTPAKSEGVFSSMEKDIHTVENSINALGREISAFQKKTTKERFSLLPENEQKKVSGVISAYEKLRTSASKIVDLTKSQSEAETRLKNLREQSNEVAGRKTAVENRIKELEINKKLYQSIKDQVEARQQAAKEQGKSYDPSKARFDDGNGGKVSYKVAVEGLEELQALQTESKELTAAQQGLAGQIGRTTNSIEQTKGALSEERENFSKTRSAVEQMGASLEGISTDGAESDIKQLNEAIEQQMNIALQDSNTGLKSAIEANTQLGQEAEQTTNKIRQQNQEFKNQNEAAGQVDGIVNRIKRFTGLTGVAMVMRRAFRNAINTVKELDKQFTEMAVVTKLDISDYWKQLPQFTAEANALGVSIKDVAAAQTLYYQQGLKTKQVQQLENSTLKMARIAGLDAAEATDKMTAALRGFNMEINQTNADRIADVYSKLAATTASNVQEISTAMTKTASIAANAGMEFETTAAFLSQIIETTRESAETAGTALKTVIARFQELKKSPDEIGEVDGEVIDANKIETALRSVGVALRDTSGQFRDLDDVFLELSGKWDSLDTNTQRYIATIAAGSRQQSRFIAMMSDYSRTQELVQEANNASGASNEQFNKTLSSLETKLNQLKNAWDTFTMGLANNEFIKAAIDILTKMLEAVNFLTKGWDSWSGSALKIGVVVTALIAGDKALRAFRLSLSQNNGILISFGKALKAPITSLKTFAANLRTSAAATIKDISSTRAAGVAKTQATMAQMRYNFAVKTYGKDSKQAIAAASKLANAQNTLKGITNASASATAATTAAEIAQGSAATVSGTALEAKALAIKTAASEQEKETGATFANIIAAGAATGAYGALTSEKVLEYEATMIANGMSEAERNERLAQIAAIYAEAGAEEVGTSAKKKGIAALIGKIGSGIAHVASLVAQTIAQWSLNVAEWAGCPPTIALTLVILALVAALLILAAIIWVVVSAIQNAIKNSPEGKFKAASEALEKASTVADQAAESYNNLKDSLTDLKDKYKALDEMTVGTQEWKDALLEVNSEVMDLIDKYPDLADAMEVDENGVMRISEEAQKEALAAKSAVNARAQSAKLAAQIAKNEAKANLDYSKLSDQAIAGDQNADTWKGIGRGAIQGAIAGNAVAGPYGVLAGAVAGLIDGGVGAHAASREMNRGSTDQLAQALAAGEINYTKPEELKQYMIDTMNMAPEAAQQWLNDLDEKTLKSLKEYGQTLNANAKAQEAAMQSMITNSMAMIDTNEYTAEELQQMNNIGTDLMEDTLNASKEAISELSDDEYKEKVKEYYSEFGEDVNVDKKGNVTYKDEEGNEVKLTKDQAEAQLAAADAADEMKKKLELLPKALSKAETQLGSKALSKAYDDKEGQKLSRQDLADLSGDALEELYNNNEELQEIYGSYEDFADEMAKRTELAQNAFTANQEKLEKLGMGDFQFDQSLDAGTEKALVKHMEQVVANSGPEVGKELGNSINDLLASVSLEDKDKLISQLNAIDWHDADALESLPETLKEIGINLPKEELDTFIAQAKDAAHAVHNIDMEKLNESLTSITALAKKIQTNEQGRKFEEEDYNTLIEADPTLKKYFRQDLDGSYVYLGESMADLTDAIIKNTEALTGEYSKYTQNKINAAEIMDDIIGRDEEKGTHTFSDYGISGDSGNDKISMSSAKSWTTEEKQAFILDLMSRAADSGASLEGISSYLSDDTTETQLLALSEDALNTIIDDLQAIYGQQQQLGEDLETNVGQALTTEKLRNDSYFSATSSTASKATRTELNKDEITDYQSSRSAIMAKAVSAGVSEVELKRMAKVNESMKELERLGKTGTDDYKKYAKEMNKFMKTIGTKTDFQNMYEGLKTNIEATNELMESYKNTTDAAEKMYIVTQMMSEFGIEVTADNYVELAKYTDAYLHGSEEGFISIIKLAGEAVGIQTDAYADLAGQSLAYIESLGVEYAEFAQSMIDAGYAYVNSVTGKFTWGTQQLLNIAKDTVEEIEMWQSPYDWLYNANSRVNAQLRERNLLEKEYTRMIEDNSGTVEDISNNLLGQINTIGESSRMYQNMYDDAKTKLTAIMDPNQNPAYAQLLKDAVAIGPNGSITVDKEKLYAAGYDSETGGVVESMIGEIESLVDTMQSSQDALEDNYDALRELAKTGKESYTTLLDRTTEALKSQYQAEIDKLNNINDAINDASEQLVSKLQEQIDEERTARERQDTLDALEDKQAKLLYLQASGGSEVDILALEKELADDQQDYQDTLVDDALSELEDANQKAADQRQEQIDLAQAQYDWWAENDAIQQAETMLEQALKDKDAGIPFVGTQVGRLLSSEEGVSTMSKVGIEDWYNELDNQANLAGIYENITTEGTTLNEAMTSAKTAVETARDAIREDTASLRLGNGDLVASESAVRLSAADIQNTINGFTNALSDLKNSITSGQGEADVTKLTDQEAIQQWVTDNNLREGDRNRWGQAMQNATLDDGRKVIDVWRNLTSQERAGIHGIKDSSDSKDSSSEEDNENTPSQDKGPYEIKRVAHENIGADNIFQMWYPLDWDDIKNGANDDTRIKIDGTEQTVKVLAKTYSDEIGNYATLNGIYEGQFFEIGGWIYILGPNKRAYALKGDDKNLSGGHHWGYNFNNLPTSNGRSYSGRGGSFATGGLADFTGPAWLDGTKSAPELVLNSTDTANFIELKDILSEILRNRASLTDKDTKVNDSDKNGNNYYNIDVHVDSIQSDYDIDQAVERMKEIIEADAMYRNVTAVSQIR